MVFDWLENWAIDAMLQAGPAGLTEQMVRSASLFSQAKAISSTVSFTLLVFVLVWWGIRRFRTRIA